MADLNWQLEYMYGLSRFGIKMGLHVVKSLTRGLGNPQEQFKSVHIAGTNGKGSVAAMMEAVLRENGYTTGLYTSPHLISFNERIRVAGRDISNAELSELIEEVRAAADVRRLQPTFEEFATAVGLTYFARSGVEMAVIETGMGGKLDATNVVTPEVAVITNIGHDHMAWLGKTKREIAERKAGIVKPGKGFVCGERDQALCDYFEQVAQARRAELHFVHDEIQTQQTSETLDGQVFATRGIVEETFELPLLGEHQLENAAVALTALHYLSERGFKISPRAMQRGLAKVSWPGRLDIVSKEPLIIVDGAHNPEGVSALHAFLQSHISKYGTKPRVLVLGIKQDKKLNEMFEKIAPMFETVICTQGNYEPMPAEELAKRVRKHHDDVQAEPEVNKALELGKAKLDKQDMMLATGSLYMIGEALKELKELKKADITDTHSGIV